MLGILKSLQSVFASIVSDLPAGLQVVLDFIWKARWFLVMGFILYSLFQAAMVALPYLLWSMVIKMAVGALFSFFSF